VDWATGKHHEQCDVKAKAESVWHGPQGSSAVGSSVSSDIAVTVTLNLYGTCWAVSSFLFQAGTGAGGHKNLPQARKRLSFGGEAKNVGRMQKRANILARSQAYIVRCILACTLALSVHVDWATGKHHEQCDVKAKAESVWHGPQGSSAVGSSVCRTG